MISATLPSAGVGKYRDYPHAVVLAALDLGFPGRRPFLCPQKSRPTFAAGGAF